MGAVFDYFHCQERHCESHSMIPCLYDPLEAFADMFAYYISLSQRMLRLIADIKVCPLECSVHTCLLICVGLALSSFVEHSGFKAHYI